MNSFEELRNTPFRQGINALCWSRSLVGNFAEVLVALGRADEGIVAVEEELLQTLKLSVDGKLAASAMLGDLQRLRELRLAPELNCITAYPRAPNLVPNDVYSFHVDRAPIETDTWLCTYYGVPSEGLRNEHAQRCAKSPELRASLLQQFGGVESAAFETYLIEQCYDLHYFPAPQAQPWSFGVGHLWRIAVQWPGSLVPPCIHRAPADVAGQRRLLLIS